MFDQPDVHVHHLIKVVKECWSQFQSKLTTEVVAYLICCGLGLVSVGYGFWRVSVAGVVEYQNAGTEVDYVSELKETDQLPQVVVEVAGAVEKPGVYTLPVGSRVAQALVQAGGATLEADQAFLAQQLNLAQEVTDQQKIYIPFWLEAEVNQESEIPSSLPFSTETTVSINSASITQLMELEGVGEKRASDIISSRPYFTIDELVSKKVVTEAQLEKIKTQISL
jgi:competence protein ComEA